MKKDTVRIISTSSLVASGFWFIALCVHVLKYIPPSEPVLSFYEYLLRSGFPILLILTIIFILSLIFFASSLKSDEDKNTD